MLAAARALAPAVAAAADGAERARELPADLVEKLHQAGMFRLLLPRSVGGLEIDLPTHVAAMEEFGVADASTAWCLNQCAGLCFLAAWLPDEARREIYGDPRAVVANGQGPDNRALVVPGGYRVTGRWAFSSGCRHATWLSGIASVVEDGQPRRRPDGSPLTRSMLFPKGQAELIDTWHVGGLRATGSHTFAVQDLFVSEHRTTSIYDDPVREPGRLYLFPQTLVFANGFGSVALGVARASIDALIELAGGKRPRGDARLLREREVVQTHVGQAEALYRAGRAMLRETVGRVWDEVSRSGEITLDQRIALRLSGTHAIHCAVQAVDLMYAAASASAIYASHPLHRRFQDAHTITQHVQGRLAHYEAAGRHLLGLEADPSWL